MKYQKQFYVTLIIWLIIELFIARLNGLYESFPQIDIFSHLFFGIAFAYFTLYQKTKNPFLWLLIVSFAWELIEMLHDKIIPQPQYLLDYFFWDGFIDIVIHIIAFIIVYNIIENQRIY